MRKLKLRLKFWYLVFLMLLNGCVVPVGEGQWKAVPEGGSSWSWSAPAAAPSPITPSPITPPKAEALANQEPDLSNIPGVQETHYVMNRAQCRKLYDKLKKSGVNLENWKFFKSGMPGSPEAGQCQLLGPGTVDNRFVDNRYETDH
jgi:hypothetical protein